MHFEEEKGPKISRRSLLKGAGALAFAPLLNVGGSVAYASASDIKTGPEVSNSHTRLVLLGTTGGMTWWPGSNRASASQVLVIGDVCARQSLVFLAQVNNPEEPVAVIPHGGVCEGAVG